MLKELGISAGTAIIILFALYFIIKIAVKNAICEFYNNITGKDKEKDEEFIKFVKEKTNDEEFTKFVEKSLDDSNSLENNGKLINIKVEKEKK